MSLNVIMLGPPASGKGTQAVRLALARGIPKISTGDILRGAGQAGTELGLKAKALMDRGELVSDEVMVDIVRERLNQPDAKGGFILDGFPRTVGQAQTLDRILEGQPLAIINLAVPDRELIHRMQGRRVCSKCAANAEPDAQGRMNAEVCGRCGGQMITRVDDGDEAVRQHRLEVYSRESKPLLDYYRSRPTFRSIDGAQAPEKVAVNLVAAIDSMMPAPVRTGSTGIGPR
jgi:adenylate kinase